MCTQYTKVIERSSIKLATTGSRQCLTVTEFPNPPEHTAILRLAFVEASGCDRRFRPFLWFPSHRLPRLLSSAIFRRFRASSGVSLRAKWVRLWCGDVASCDSRGNLAINNRNCKRVGYAEQMTGHDPLHARTSLPASAAAAVWLYGCRCWAGEGDVALILHLCPHVK